MRSRLAIVGIVVVAAILLISGLRWVPVTPGGAERYSGPICGPLTDGAGNPAGDAGPCPSPTAPREELTWAPFWVAD